MLAEAFRHQHTADQDEKAEREHLDGRMSVHEITDLIHEDEHDDHRDDHGSDHDSDLLDHPDGSNDRVEREDDIEQHDLDDHLLEVHRHLFGFLAVHAFELFVNLTGTLPEQKHSPDDQN